MNSFIRLGLGLLFVVGAIGCHCCHHGCGCDDHDVVASDHGVCESCGGPVCERCDVCEECHKEKPSKHKKKKKHSKKSDKRESCDGSCYGYGKHVIYTGEDWDGIPHPPMMPGMMPWGSMGVCCDSCNMPMMELGDCASCGGCASCDSGVMPPVPSAAVGCTSCTANAAMMPQTENFGCTACQAGQHPHLQPTPAGQRAGGTCAHCGPGHSVPDSFYSPMQPGNNTPAPAPPAIESNPTPATPDTSTPNSNDQSSSGPIQKLQWVPRQL